MSRAELAESVCNWLWETTDTQYDLDGHYIAKMERGAVRWPGAAYRSGLRHVLNVSSDSELGFTQTGPAGSFETDLTQHSTIGLADDLIDAGDESVTMLALAEESKSAISPSNNCTADIERIAQNYLKVPTKPLFDRTKAVRDRAFKLLAGRQPPPPDP